jgi:site-specific recombinase XerD
MTHTPIDSPTFSKAAAAWFEKHKTYIKPTTARSYNCAIEPLTRVFGDKRINEIEIVHIRMYQGARNAKVCANTVNREVGVLQQVLREFDHWRRLESRYTQLQEPSPRIARSLSAEEEQRLREVAFTKPKWRLAGHCMMVMLSTGMGFGELRHVRRRDVNMQRKCLVVRDETKNANQVRTIPLNSAARKSMAWILARWKKLGGCDPKHYILPHRPRKEASHSGETTSWILDEPMLTISAAFRSIRKVADLPAFRVDDCRAQAVTKLLGNGIAQEQHLSGQSDDGRDPRGTGNLVRFPLPGAAAFTIAGVQHD